MNKLKRFLALFLVLSMMLGVVPFGVFAAEGDEAPAQETVAPAEETEALAEETEVPAEETEAPADETEAPAEETEVPVEETVAPVEETEAPAEETVAPVEETDEAQTLAVSVSSKPADGTTTGEPFPQGTGGSNSFRIPALVTLSDGTLVAAADARWNTTYDGGGLDTIVARSSDKGATWNYTFANYLGDNGNTYNGSSSTCFIDPALAVTADDTIYMLVDLYPYGVALNGDNSQTTPSAAVGFNSNGKLLLSGDNHSTYSYYLDGNTIYSSNGTAVDGYTVDAYFNITGTDGTSTNLFFSDSPYKVVRTGYLYLTKSTDKGATWSEPTLLNLKTTSENVCLVGPGRGLVTADGTIVFPCYSYTSSREETSFIYSTDNGATWQRSASLNTIDSSEAAVVELNDGTLRFFFRNHTASLCYADYSFTNGWSSYVNTGIATNSNTQISAITYSKTVDGKQVILVSCPTGPNEAGSSSSSASNRLNGKIFVGLVNEDGTMDWQTDKSVAVTSSDSQFMYSCLAELNDGKVAILYEDQESSWGTGSSCYYTMSYSTYDLGLDTDTDEDNEGDEATDPTEPEPTVVDSVTSNGGSGTSYVLDTDGVDSNAQYLIVYNGNALTYNGNSYSSTAVTENDDGTATVTGDVSNALWTRQNDGFYNAAQEVYLRVNYNGIQAYGYSTATAVSTYSDGYHLYRDGTTDYYLRYNNGWTGTYYSSYATRVKLYKYTEGTESWTVDAALQESRITALTVSNDGYTDESWNAYQAALTAANAKLAEVEAATYSTEEAATAALNELIAAVDALETAKNALVKAVSITVNYQENGTTVATATLNVAENATSVSLPESVLGNNGKTYTVDNTTLALTSGTTSYNVSVTELEGTPVTIKENETMDISVTLSNGQYVEWSSADGSYVGVAGKYDSTAGAYTDTAVIVGQNITTDPVVVTGTVYNADGSIASVNKWLVTVTEGDGYNSNNANIYLEITQIENCTVYYAVNGGELIKVNGTGLWAENGNKTESFNVMFFAAPDEGYALTYMYIESTDNQYYALSNGNPDGTGSDAWPFDSATQSTIPSTSTDSAWVDGHGFRWCLLEGNMSIEQMKIMFSQAIALGCDGATNLTKNSSQTMGTASDPIELKFVAQKLPTLEKEITSITHDGTTSAYTDGMKVEIGDTITYTVTVTRYATVAAYGTIEYSNESLTDALTNNNGISNPDMGTSTTSDQTYTYTTSLSLTKDNFAAVVQNGTITNTAEFSYSYKSEYSNGSLTADASAVAEITVEVPSYVIDFGLPVAMNLSDLTTAYGSITSAVSANGWGSVAVDGSTVTYTPTSVLEDVDYINLTFGSGNYAIAIYPATTVFYEEGFGTYTGTWTSTGSKGSGTQAAVAAGASGNNYGYDDAYKYNAAASSGTAASTSTVGAAATFTFTGTGLDIYANCTSTSGAVAVKIKNSAGSMVKFYQVDTAVTAGNSNATSDQTGDYYSLPIVSVQGLSETPETYTVTITNIKKSSDSTYTTVSLDGFRVYNTIGASSTAYVAEEQNPSYVELRDMVLTGLNVGVDDLEVTNSAQIWTQVYESTGTTKGVLYLSYNNEENQGEATATDVATAEDLLENGPKNELYLYPGFAATFNLAADAQIGLKSPTGAATYTINGTAYTIGSSADMFYDVSAGDVTITCTSGLLSVTLLKAGTSVTGLFEEVTVDQVATALASIGFVETPEVPVEDDVTAVSASLSLDGDIGINFYYKLSDAVLSDAETKVVFTLANGETQTVALADAMVTDNNGQTNYGFSCKVSAKQMSEEIAAQVYTSAGAVGDSVTYSVVKYCQKVLDTVSDSALTGLVKAMLNYGAAAQVVFDYNTDALANAGLSDEDKVLSVSDDLSAYKTVVSGAEEGIQASGATLLLDSTTTIRYYFQLTGEKAISDYEFIVNGEVVEPVASGDLYYVDMVDIAAKDLDEAYTASVGGLSIAYSALSYVYSVRNYQGASAALLDAVNALYLYNQAANVYFA